MNGMTESLNRHVGYVNERFKKLSGRIDELKLADKLAEERNALERALDIFKLG